MSLNSGQQIAYNVMMNGGNVFLTGGAGVGKTYTLMEFVKAARNNGKNVIICAPTGIAALNVGGTTCHRQFKAPLGVIDYNRNMYSADDSLVYADIVIIEEISMCRIDLFDFICNKIADANAQRRRLNKSVIQLIVCGDFFQLPPVILDGERKALNAFYNRDVGVGFAFDSMFWNMLDFKTVMLTEVMRQADAEFIDRLNRIRVGEKAYIHELFNNSCKDYLESSITLCGKNSEATEKNELELSRIDNELVEFEAIIEGDANQNDVSVDLLLHLKVGARVMTLVNGKDGTETEGMYNGSFGTILDIFDDSVVLGMDNGSILEIERFTWDVFRYEVEADELGHKYLVENRVGSVKQFPLKLAYAITIHKSQGQTYESANLSPYAWDCGQLYVAISRVKSLDKIHFNYMPDMQYLVVSLTVIKFYNSLNYVYKLEELKINENKETGIDINGDKDLSNDLDFILNSLR